MAAKAKGQASDWRAPRLVGKRFVFAGRGGPRAVAKLARAEGAEVLPEVAADVDFLVVQRYPGDKPTEAEKKAEQLIRKGAFLRIIGIEDYCKLFLPGREEALAMLSAGEEGVRRWQELAGQYWIKGQVDLRGAQLRGARLKGVNFRIALLDGADLRDADLTGRAFLDNLDGVRLDNARLEGSGLHGLRDCRLRGIDLTEGSIAKATNCNLEGARLVKARLGGLVGCRLRKADLSEVQFGRSASLEKSDLTGACLKRAAGSGAQGPGAVFHNANLTGARLDRSHFPEADFRGADLSGANLEQTDLRAAQFSEAKLVKADLSGAKLCGADLTEADLRGANLAGADLSDAVLEGANCEGANLTAATLAGVDLERARGIDKAHRSAGRLGPKVRELESVAGQSARLTMRAILDVDDRRVEVRLAVRGPSSLTNLWVQGQPQQGHPAPLGDALVYVAQRWAGGTLRPDALTVTSQGCPLGTRELRNLVVAAWCEARGEPVPSAQELRTRKADRLASEQETRTRLLADLRTGIEGVERWNARTPDELKRAGHFRGADLSGADLRGVVLSTGNASLNFQAAHFEDAILTGAQALYGKFRQANFQGANCQRAQFGISSFEETNFAGAALVGCSLRVCNFRRASFQGADLRQADLGHSDLRGADLSSANLKGTTFEQTRYDEQTRWPSGFTPPKEMKWAGTGPAPGTAPTPAVSAAPGAPLSFEGFLNRLRAEVDPARLVKALDMLKAERFQLYAQVDSGAVVGVVKSQRDVNLVYSCRLTSEGTFACCTQDLITCGGLKGRVCKHILVLVVGLTRAGRLDAEAALGWVAASRQHRQQIDKERMSETFLRYRGAEAGEVDWRPTETLPEDYYAL